MNRWIKKLLSETTLSHQSLREAWAIIELHLSDALGVSVGDFGDEENQLVYEAMKKKFGVDVNTEAVLFAKQQGVPARIAIASKPVVERLVVTKKTKTLEKNMTKRDQIRSYITKKAKELQEDGVAAIGGMGAVGTPSEVIMSGPAPVSMKGAKKKKVGKKAKTPKKSDGTTKNIGKTWGQHVSGLPEVENAAGSDLLKNALSTDAFVNEMIKRR